MKNNRIVRLLAAIAAAAALAGLGGCAAPAHKENMEATSIASTKKLPYSVTVQAAGGQETGAMDSSNVSNADLKAAIEGSIIKTNLFKSVVQTKGGDYELTVTVANLNKPMFGGAFTVTM
jgi:alpha-acetolactate decarboxylase